MTESLDIVESYEIQTGEIKSSITLKGMSDGEKALLSEYIRNKVILVCTPLPEDTDVAAYFEIMNNRGEQLQAHEVIKALLMSDLGTSQRYIFSTVWDACSQMDIPIQKTLSKLRNKGLFGEQFDGLNLEIIDNVDFVGSSIKNEYTIDRILDSGFTYDNHDAEDMKEETDTDLKSIIDFPNFLMHAMRLYAEAEKKMVNAVPLNADKMPVTKPEFISDSMDFIKALLRIRVLLTGM